MIEELEKKQDKLKGLLGPLHADHEAAVREAAIAVAKRDALAEQYNIIWDMTKVLGQVIREQNGKNPRRA